jgi:N6-L-threonylcarbamoyladenine synthase
MDKIHLAVKRTGISSVAIGGGVSANTGIRNALQRAEKAYGWHTFIPKFEYCTDNAAMIGIVGYLKYLQKDFTDQAVSPKARFIMD